MRCVDPNCDHTDCDDLYLEAECHPYSPPWLRFSKSLSTLIVECSVCQRDIAMIEVGTMEIHLNTQEEVKAVDEALEIATSMWRFDAKQSGDPRCLDVAEEYVNVRKTLRARLEYCNNPPNLPVIE